MQTLRGDNLLASGFLTSLLRRLSQSGQRETNLRIPPCRRTVVDNHYVYFSSPFFADHADPRANSDALSKHAGTECTPFCFSGPMTMQTSGSNSRRCRVSAPPRARQEEYSMPSQAFRPMNIFRFALANRPLLKCPTVPSYVALLGFESVLWAFERRGVQVLQRLICPGLETAQAVTAVWQGVGFGPSHWRRKPRLKFPPSAEPPA